MAKRIFRFAWLSPVVRVPALGPGIDPRIHLLARKMDCRVGARQ